MYMGEVRIDFMKRLKKSALSVAVVFVALVCMIFLVFAGKCVVLNLVDYFGEIYSLASQHLLGSFALNPVFLLSRFFALVACLYLFIVLFTVFSSVISLNMYEFCARTFKYRLRNIKDIIFKAMSWNFYRIYHVLRPMLKVIGIIASFIVFSLIFFNQLLFLAGYNLQMVIFIWAFIFFMLFFSFIISVGMGVWNFITTFFGMECAVSEPFLPNEYIVKRSRSLVFNKTMNLFMYTVYCTMIMLLLIEFVILSANYVLIANNYYYLGAIVMLNVLFYMFISYFKTALYLDSLINRYNQMLLSDYPDIFEKIEKIVTTIEKDYNLVVSYVKDLIKSLEFFKNYHAGVKKLGR